MRWRNSFLVSAQLAALAPQVLPPSLLGKAVNYTLGQWPKLTAFLKRGEVPLDNNRCENAIRPFVIGRNGWLFSDTVQGAVASANLYSLVETAKANGLEPHAYLSLLFECWRPSNIDPLGGVIFIEMGDSTHL